MDNRRNIRRKNRKIKFSENKYVERYYFQEDKAVIPVELKEVSDSLNKVLNKDGNLEEFKIEE